MGGTMIKRKIIELAQQFTRRVFEPLLSQIHSDIQ